MATHSPDSDMNVQQEARRDSSDGSFVMVPERSWIMQDAKVQELRKFFSEVRTLFIEIIMIAAFTGGVQAAILSFFRDLFSDDEFKINMWPQDQDHPGHFRYSRYSLGLLVGLYAIVLSLAVGAIAAVNTAIASYCLLYSNLLKMKPREDELQMIMQNRVFLCMLIQLMAFITTGLSLILLTAKLHWPFTVVAGFLGLLAIFVCIWHFYVVFKWEWVEQVEWHHAISAVLCTSALGFDLGTPSRTTWFTFTAFGMTLAAHMIFMLYKRVAANLHGNRPLSLAMVGAFFFSMVWAGCAVSTIILGARSAGWARINTYIVCGLSGAEAALLFGKGVWDAIELVRKREKKPSTESNLGKGST